MGDGAFILQQPKTRGLHTRNTKAVQRLNRRLWNCVDCMAGLRAPCSKDCPDRRLGSGYLADRRDR